jgi:hypothetical protein
MLTKHWLEIALDFLRLPRLDAFELAVDRAEGYALHYTNRDATTRGKPFSVLSRYFLCLRDFHARRGKDTFNLVCDAHFRGMRLAGGLRGLARHF